MAKDSYLSTEVEVSCGNCSWTNKTVVTGNTLKSSPAIQREDGWVVEIHLWINILHGKICPHAASGTFTFYTAPQHTIQIALAPWKSGSKAKLWSTLLHSNWKFGGIKKGGEGMFCYLDWEKNLMAFNLPWYLQWNQNIVYGEWYKYWNLHNDWGLFPMFRSFPEPVISA